jgi:hypothetical protein
MDILDLQKDVLDLSKAFELNLQKAGLPATLRMQARLAVDKSGSMDKEIKCGWVQKAVDIFLAAALKFDDDGRLSVGAFNESLKELPDATIEDAGTYVQKHDIRAGGGTKYAPVLHGMARHASTGWVGRLLGRTADPIYLGVITDGDCYDRNEFEAALHNLDRNRVFVHFFGIGDEVDVEYLARITKRHVNTAFDHLLDPNTVTAEDFYVRMCSSKFAEWVKLNNIA